MKIFLVIYSIFHLSVSQFGFVFCCVFLFSRVCVVIYVCAWMFDSFCVACLVICKLMFEYPDFRFDACILASS